jgi:hypothetical protein
MANARRSMKWKHIRRHWNQTLAPTGGEGGGYGITPNERGIHA